MGTDISETLENDSSKSSCSGCIYSIHGTISSNIYKPCRVCNRSCIYYISISEACETLFRSKEKIKNDRIKK